MCDVLIAPGHHPDAPGALLRVGERVISEHELMAPLARELERTLPARVSSEVIERPNPDPDWAYADEIKSYGADLMVELHFNGVKDPQAHGSEMLYRAGDRRSKRLAQELLSETTARLGTKKRRLVPKSDGYHVYGRVGGLSLVLAEPAFGSNKSDAWALLSQQADLIYAYRTALLSVLDD